TRSRVVVSRGNLSGHASRLFDNRPEAKPTRYVTTAGSPAKRGHHRSRREKERPALCSQTTGLFAFGGVKAQPYNHNGASEVRFEFSYFHAVPGPMIAAFEATFEPVACEGRRGAGCPPDAHTCRFAHQDNLRTSSSGGGAGRIALNPVAADGHNNAQELPRRKAAGFTKNKWEDAVLRIFARVVFPAFVLLSVLDAARAEAIAIGNYGASANGMPFGVALAKGYFQEEGANVTSIIASEGGGASVRNAMSVVPYGEPNPGAIAVAIQQGADLRIVSDNVLTIAEFAWLVKKDSPIKTIADLRGKKIGYTNPRSTSQALDILMLAKAGLKPEDAELVKTGGFGPMVAALELGQIDVAPV